MTVEDIYKDVLKLSKEELQELVLLMLKKNGNNIKLVNNKLHNKKPLTTMVLKRIRKEMAHHLGSYKVAFDTFKDFVQISPDTQSILEISLETSKYFFEELEVYGPEFPIKLHEYSVEIYEVALQSAKELHDLYSAQALYDMIPFDNDGIFESLIETFYWYFNIDDDENVVEE